MKTNVSRVENEKTVIFGSKIVVCEGRRPMRIVLREEPGQFIVHAEYLDASMEVRDMRLQPTRYEYELVFTHSCFDQGNYFVFNSTNGVMKETAKIDAEKCFYERAAKL